jgi:transcriptional regulator with XRE-family HTH domain
MMSCMGNRSEEILGKEVRFLRRKRGISQESLADACGLHRTYIGSVERGERNVSLQNIVRIARALGVAPANLLKDVK